MTHICVSKLIIICSDNGLSPGRRQAIILTNARILLIGPLGTNFSEILIEIPASSLKNAFKNVVWKIAAILLGLNVLTHRDLVKLICVIELLHHCFRFAPVPLQTFTWTNSKYFRDSYSKIGSILVKMHLKSRIFCQVSTYMYQTLPSKGKYIANCLSQSDNTALSLWDTMPFHWHCFVVADIQRIQRRQLYHLSGGKL